jgi:predicted nucleic-acid-binding Zn-ribbon protein
MAGEPRGEPLAKGTEVGQRDQPEAPPGPATLPTRQELTDALVKAGATFPCPRCGNPNFALIESAALPTLGPNTVDLGRTIPVAVVACTKCGYLSQHAYGVLGLLRERKEGG